MLAAAVHCFNEKGYAAAGMAEIAAASDVSVGTLYNYFACKADLALAILVDDRTIVADLEQAAILAAGSDPLERIARFLETDVFHGCTELDRSVWVEIEAAALTNAAMRAHLERMNDELRANLVRLLQAMQAEGQLTSHVDLPAAVDLLCQVGRTHHLRHVSDQAEPERIASSIRAQVAVICNGIGVSNIRESH